MPPVRLNALNSKLISPRTMRRNKFFSYLMEVDQMNRILIQAVERLYSIHFESLGVLLRSRRQKANIVGLDR
ncbi:hypothetical protein JOD82_005277 [Paenibacillus sp. 1182]|jgi:hypothetical protein|nr:hypothetical protein [Paenibacillus sp. 1182]